MLISVLPYQTLPRLSRHAPTNGAIKSAPEDFVVREITQEGTILEENKHYEGPKEGAGKFARFVMQKRNWNTMQALKEIAGVHGKGVRSIGFAGTKDRTSISVQLCSMFGVEPEEVLNTSIKDVSINGAWKSAEGIKLGDLLGNRFSVTVLGNSDAGPFFDIENGLGGVFPNYYGEQRFGYRNNNLEIGISMLKGDYRKALLSYLTDVSNEKLEESVEARKRLADELDFQEALRYFPRHLKYERSVIEYISRFPGSYQNAMKRLPRHLSLMFVHSVESHVFNAELSDRVMNAEVEPKEGDSVCGPNFYGFPDIGTAMKQPGAGKGKLFMLGNVVGYDTEKLTDTERKTLEELGITTEMFRLRGMPELSSKGTLRPLFAPYLGFNIIDGENPTLEFSLPNGSYATTLLREFVDVRSTLGVAGSVHS